MPPIQDDDLTPDEREFMARGTAAAPAAAPAEAPAPAPAAAAPAAEDDDAAAAPAAAPAPAEAPAPAPAAAEGAEDNEGAIDQASLEAVAADDPARRPTYDEPAPRDFDAERKAVKDDQAAITKQWRDGELTDEDYDAKMAPLNDKLEVLLVERTEARTIERLNQQAVAQSQHDVLAAIARASKDAGLLDYSDAKVATAYDTMLRAVAGDPENAGNTFAELADKAHRALCAVRGVQAAAPAPTAAAPTPAAAPASAPAAAPKPVIPQTLHGMPVAGNTPMGNDLMNTLAATDDPDAAEDMIAALPRNQREGLMRATVGAGGRR